MKYESPLTIRARQTRAENRRPRRRARPRAIHLMTDAEWADKCEFHAMCILDLYADLPDSTGAHARALVHMAVARRAHQVMNDLDLRDYWKAEDIAKHELLNAAID